MRHELFVYRSRWFYSGDYVADCEPHKFTVHSRLFSDAVGRALMHKWAHQ